MILQVGLRGAGSSICSNNPHRCIAVHCFWQLLPSRLCVVAVCCSEAQMLATQNNLTGMLVAPAGVAVGLLLRHSYSAQSPAALIVNGAFNGAAYVILLPAARLILRSITMLLLSCLQCKSVPLQVCTSVSCHVCEFYCNKVFWDCRCERGHPSVHVPGGSHRHRLLQRPHAVSRTQGANVTIASTSLCHLSSLQMHAALHASDVLPTAAKRASGALKRHFQTCCTTVRPGCVCESK